jgi:hypothetical protein
MTAHFHKHAITLVTANLIRCMEYYVESIPNSEGMFMVKLPIESVQADFLGPVQWVSNYLDDVNHEGNLDDVNAGVVARLDRAAGVHDYFPMFRRHFVSNGEYCSCQYPTMQKLPCEHCLAVIVIKLQAHSLPDCHGPWKY